MISIEYLHELLAGEPGPNFYWRGTPEDILSLVVEMHSLGRANGVEKILNVFPNVKVIGNYEIVARSSVGGDTLCSKGEGVITIDLDCTIWRLILAVFLSTSFYPCHEYIDLEGLNLKEDAGFIISSEGGA